MSKAQQKTRTPTLNAGIEGVAFADELSPDEAAQAKPPQTDEHLPSTELEATPATRTAESTAANQEAIKEHFRAQKSAGINRETLGQEFIQAQIQEASPEVAQAARPKVFAVLEDAWIARGGGRYRLPAGKHITENDYNIAQLKKYGVKLAPVELPPLG